MITKVSAVGTGVYTHDSKRKSQSVNFQHRTNQPYNKSYNEQYEKQRTNAVLTSVAAIAGAVLFTLGYFLATGLKSTKPILK